MKMFFSHLFVLCLGLVAALFHGALKYEEGMQDGSVRADVGRLILAQQRFVHDSVTPFIGMDYIDSALELASHHFDVAARNVSKATLRKAIDLHLNEYAETYGTYKITGLSPQISVLGLEGKGSFRVVRHRDLSPRYPIGAAGNLAIKDLIDQIVNKLPEKMSGGIVSEE